MPLTISEQLFESYMVSQGLTDFEYEKKHEGKKSRPDYILRVNDRDYIFDVKEFDPPPFVTGCGAYDPLPAVREKINKVGKQFKEFKDQVCCLVLYNNGDPFVHLQDPDDMQGAMYGDPGIAWDFDVTTGRSVPDSERPVFGTRGKMIRPHWTKAQNTTISALITLRHLRLGQAKYGKFIHDLRVKGLLEDASIRHDFDIEEEHLSVIVWENAFARIPFPRELFCGLYDERYGQEGDYVKRIYVGKGVLEYELLNER